MFDCSRDAPEELVVLYSRYSRMRFETLGKGLVETLGEDERENNYDSFSLNRRESAFETDCYILLKRCRDKIQM